MDPTAAWNTLNTESLDLEERADAAAALVGWLKSGGYPPAGLPVDAVIALCALKLAEAWESR